MFGLTRRHLPWLPVGTGAIGVILAAIGFPANAAYAFTPIATVQAVGSPAPLPASVLCDRDQLATRFSIRGTFDWKPGRSLELIESGTGTEAMRLAVSGDGQLALLVRTPAGVRTLSPAPKASAGANAYEVTRTDEYLGVGVGGPASPQWISGVSATCGQLVLLADYQPRQGTPARASAEVFQGVNLSERPLVVRLAGWLGALLLCVSAASIAIGLGARAGGRDSD